MSLMVPGPFVDLQAPITYVILGLEYQLSFRDPLGPRNFWSIHFGHGSFFNDGPGAETAPETGTGTPENKQGVTLSLKCFPSATGNGGQGFNTALWDTHERSLDGKVSVRNWLFWPKTEFNVQKLKTALVVNELFYFKPPVRPIWETRSWIQSIFTVLAGEGWLQQDDVRVVTETLRNRYFGDHGEAEVLDDFNL